MKKIILIVIMLTFSTCITAQIAVIANKSIKISSIDKTTLKNLYELNSNQLAGEKVKLFDITGDDNVISSFYSYINNSVSEIKKKWMKAKLTGNGNPPEFVNSYEEMVSKVASTKGGIGYVKQSLVKEDVKVLLIIK